jgi:hypothetical protein
MPLSPIQTNNMNGKTSGLSDLENAFSNTGSVTSRPSNPVNTQPVRQIPRALKIGFDPAKPGSEYTVKQVYPIVGTETGRANSEKSNLSEVPRQAFVPRPAGAQVTNPHVANRVPQRPPERGQYENRRYDRQPYAQPQLRGMKFLVAAPMSRVRNKRNNDVVLCKVGELLFAPSIPHGAFADDDEGLARTFVGVETGNRTTFATLSVIEIKEDQFFKMVLGHLHKTMPDMAINYEKQAWEIVRRTMKIAQDFNVGQIVEYRDGRAASR